MADQKKIGGFGLIGILIVIAVIALASGVGLYWNETKKQQSFLQTGADVIKRAEELKKEIESRQKSIYGGSTSINNTSDVDTSSWKTYRNEKYGFEVKYPDGWKIFLPTVNSLIISNRELPQTVLQKQDIYINITIDSNASKSGDLITWANFNVHILEFEGYDIKVIDEQSIILAGKPAIRVIYDLRAPSTDGTDRLNTSFIIANNRGYIIGFDPSDSELRSIFDKILSTLKFIE